MRQTIVFALALIALLAACTTAIPAAEAPAEPTTPALPKLNNHAAPSGDDAATTAEAIAQAKKGTSPELRNAVDAFEKSGIKLDKGQLDLFNANKGALGL